MTRDGASFTPSAIITQNVFCSLVRPSFLPLLLSRMFLLRFVLFHHRQLPAFQKIQEFPHWQFCLSYFITKYDLPCSIFLFFTPPPRKKVNFEVRMSWVLIRTLSFTICLTLSRCSCFWPWMSFLINNVQHRTTEFLQRIHNVQCKYSENDCFLISLY